MVHYAALVLTRQVSCVIYCSKGFHFVLEIYIIVSQRYSGQSVIFLINRVCMVSLLKA